LTIELVCIKVVSSPHILKYLPDEPAQNVTKSYLYTIVNTIDA